MARARSFVNHLYYCYSRSVEVREVRAEEYDEAGRVVALAYSEFSGEPDQGWDDHIALVRDVSGRVDRTVVLVAVEGSRVLGSATIELDGVIGDDDHELPPDGAVLRMVGVDPAARGMGVGRALVQAVADRARAAGRRVLILRTTPQMVAAHRLYASIGFVRDPSLDMPVYEDFDLLGYRLDL
jgi:GNAT superfamily N-acetyltransferase